MTNKCLSLSQMRVPTQEWQRGKPPHYQVRPMDTGTACRVPQSTAPDLQGPVDLQGLHGDGTNRDSPCRGPTSRLFSRRRRWHRKCWGAALVSVRGAAPQGANRGIGQRRAAPGEGPASLAQQRVCAAKLRPPRHVPRSSHGAGSAKVGPKRGAASAHASDRPAQLAVGGARCCVFRAAANASVRGAAAAVGGRGRERHAAADGWCADGWRRAARHRRSARAGLGRVGT